MKTLIWRHRKENLKKCSLSGLESRRDILFFTYPAQLLPDLSNTLILKVDAPPLTQADGGYDLLLVDATWRYAEVMLRQLPHNLTARSLPSHFTTAYPRRQEVDGGLASVEALYLAHLILGRDREGLLDGYHWRDEFLLQNGLQKV